MVPIVDKISKNRSRWLRNVLRRGETKAVRVVRGIYVEINKARERSKQRWADVINNDMKWVGVSKEGVEDRVLWKLGTRVADHK